jgi:hypothetical protein
MRSQEYLIALENAKQVLAEVEQKLAGGELTTEEGERLLNSQQAVLLLAIKEEDLVEVEDTIDFIAIVVLCLNLFGYVVTCKNNVYCVKHPQVTPKEVLNWPKL